MGRRLLVVVVGAALLAAAACSSDPDPDTDIADEPVEPGVSAETDEAVDGEEAPTSPVNPTEQPTTSPEPAGSPTPATACADRRTGTSGYTLDVDGLAYDVAVHVPEDLDSSTPAPVVLNWHGLGGTGPLHSAFTGFDQLADDNGFIVVAPTGPPLGSEGMTAWELDGFDEPGRDDVAFAAALIDDVLSRFCGDERRVYSIGMSNGGLFTSRLICELGDTLAAAVSVAGLSHPDGCTADPVPFVAYHGTADFVVPFDASVGPSVLDHPITGAFAGQSMTAEFAEFAADMGCGAPESSDVPPDVIRHDYPGCDGGVTLTFYEVVDGGHTWPGPLPGDGTQTVDATAGSWAFFSEQVQPAS